MGNSVYKMIELVGTSTESWEKAAEVAWILFDNVSRKAGTASGDVSK